MKIMHGLDSSVHLVQLLFEEIYVAFDPRYMKIRANAGWYCVMLGGNLSLEGIGTFSCSKKFSILMSIMRTNMANVRIFVFYHESSF